MIKMRKEYIEYNEGKINNKEKTKKKKLID
jgi:hypothetical protein